MYGYLGKHERMLPVAVLLLLLLFLKQIPNTPLPALAMPSGIVERILDRQRRVLSCDNSLLRNRVFIDSLALVAVLKGAAGCLVVAKTVINMIDSTNCCCRCCCCYAG